MGGLARGPPKGAQGHRAGLEGLGPDGWQTPQDRFGRSGSSSHLGSHPETWTDERVLERYELLFEAGLVPEALRDAQPPASPKVRLAPGQPMALDHRRILATAIGRLRGKIKYRPVIFELMPASFTLLDLQRTVEALSGVRLHKQNFRRLVEMQGLGGGNRRGRNRNRRAPSSSRALSARGAGRATGPRCATAPLKVNHCCERIMR